MSTSKVTDLPSWNTLRDAPQELAKAVERYHIQQEKIVTSPYISQEQKQKWLTRHVVNLERDLRDYETQLREAKTEAEQEFAGLLTPTAPTKPEDALLLELRQQRTWDRIKPQLDAGGGASVYETVEAITQEAIARNDQLMLTVLKEELPHYTRALPIEDRPLGEHAVKVVDQALTTFLSADDQERLGARKDLEQVWARAENAVATVRHALAQHQLREEVILPPAIDAEHRVAVTITPPATFAKTPKLDLPETPEEREQLATGSSDIERKLETLLFEKTTAGQG